MAQVLEFQKGNPCQCKHCKELRSLYPDKTDAEIVQIRVMEGDPNSLPPTV